MIDFLSPGKPGYEIHSSAIQRQRKRIAEMSKDEVMKLYRPPPTYGAAEEHIVAMDSHLEACGYTSLIQHSMLNGLAWRDFVPQFLGYPILAGLSQNPLISAGVTTVADDMTKKWVRVRWGDDPKPEQKDAIAKMRDQMEEWNLQAIFNEAAQKCDFDGGCLVFIDVDDPERPIDATKINTPDDPLRQPLLLDPQLWGSKRIRRFVLVEAINVYPDIYNANDPLSPTYFNPQHFLILGRKVHRSRFLYFAPNTLPSLFRPAYNFFGIPVAQQVMEYVAHFTDTREAAQRLLTKFSMTVWKGKLAAALATDQGVQSVLRRLQVMAEMRDNEAVIGIDKDEEDIIKLETPLAGTVDIVRQSLEFVAAIFRIPFTKFLGISPGGLNATGESDERNYYDHVQSKQEKIFLTPLKKVNKLLQLHLFGSIDSSIKIEFEPLRDTDDLQQATVFKTLADTVAVLGSSGHISEEEGRTVLKDATDSPLAFIKPAEVPPPPEGESMFGNTMEESEAFSAAESE